MIDHIAIARVRGALRRARHKVAVARSGHELADALARLQSVERDLVALQVGVLS